MSERFSHSGFSDASIKVIRAYEEHDWIFSVSKKGHAIGRAPDGIETVSIARDLTPADRSQQNSEATLKRWIREQAQKSAPDHVTLARPLMATLWSGGTHPSRVATVAAGVALGWTPERMVNGSIRLTRTGQRAVVVRITDKSLTRREFRDLQSRLVRGGDPVVAALSRGMDERGWTAYVLEAFETTDLLERVAVAVPKADAPPAARTKPETRTAPEPVLVPSTDEVVVDLEALAAEDSITRQPWMATRSGGQYESKAVVEIRQGGDVLGYECSVCTWGYIEGAKPHSVAAHYRRAHRLGKGKDQVNPVTERAGADYHPTQRLIDALADYLAAHPDEDVVLAALTWMSTRPDLPLPEPREPLTDTQILAKVRALVGGGPSEEEYDGLVEELREAEEAIEAGRQREIDLNIRLAEVEADRNRLQTDLDTWLSLAPTQRGEAS